jgi:hypothetical protein
MSQFRTVVTMPGLNNIGGATLRSFLGLAVLWLAACQPTVKVEAPDKPIVINMNVDIRVRLERDVQELLQQNEDVF